MGRRRSGIPGLSFSWKRAVGLSAAKGRLSRQIGIPLTRSGRRQKLARAAGCALPIMIFVAIGSALAILSIRAQAADPSLFPQIDVEANCESQPKFGDRQQQIYAYNRCIDRNQYAYNYIKRVWPYVSDNIYAKCKKMNEEASYRRKNSKFAYERANHGDLAYELWEECVYGFMKSEQIQNDMKSRRSFQP